MSLMTTERPTFSSQARVTVRELFDEANAIDSQICGYSFEALHQIAEQLLPEERLRQFSAMLPSPQLTAARWMGCKAGRRSLIIALTYRTGYRRDDQVVVVGTADHIQGIRVCGRHTKQYALPGYADELPYRIERIVEDFVHDCTRH